MGSEIQGYFPIHSKIEAGLRFLSPFPGKKKQQKKGGKEERRKEGWKMVLHSAERYLTDNICTSSVSPLPVFSICSQTKDLSLQWGSGTPVWSSQSPEGLEL